MRQGFGQHEPAEGGVGQRGAGRGQNGSRMSMPAGRPPSTGPSTKPRPNAYQPKARARPFWGVTSAMQAKPVRMVAAGDARDHAPDEQQRERGATAMNT
jgi:hypothetical protein